MNGNTMKATFTGIVITLCLILLVMTYLASVGKIPLDIYKEIITMLGIPTLIGMIVQAFIHADFNKDGIPDHQQTENSKGEKKNEEIISN